VIIAAMAAVTAVALVAASALGGATIQPRVIVDGELGEVEVYDVGPGAVLSPAPDPASLAAEVWTTFVRIATPAYAEAMIGEFHVADDADVDVAAWVVLDEETRRWTLAANLAFSDVPRDLVTTLVHELAHVLTLEAGEMSTSPGACPTLRLDEGCLADDAVLWAFQQRFWAGYGESAPTVGSDDRDAGRAFFEAHEEDFVSDYAATNVIEDIAESFMTFVLEDRPRGDSVAAQKLEFFWGIPESVAMRERIRAEFADELGLIP
jgi:hypothetical protein